MPQPLDAEAVARAFEDAAETGQPVGDKLSRVGEAALNELLRRLEDPELAAELPGTGLLNIANAYVKLRQKELEQPAKETREVDVLELIEQTDLSAERRAALVGAELRKTNDRRLLLEAALNRGEQHE